MSGATTNTRPLDRAVAYMKTLKPDLTYRETQPFGWMDSDRLHVTKALCNANPELVLYYNSHALGNRDHFGLQWKDESCFLANDSSDATNFRAIKAWVDRMDGTADGAQDTCFICGHEAPIFLGCRTCAAQCCHQCAIDLEKKECPYCRTDYPTGTILWGNDQRVYAI